MNDPSAFPAKRVWALVAYFGLAAIPLAGVSLKSAIEARREPMIFLGIFGFAVAALLGAAAYGLVFRRRWAWSLAAFLIALEMVLAVGVLTLVLLFESSSRVGPEWTRLGQAVLPVMYVGPALFCVVSCRSDYDRSTRG